MEASIFQKINTSRGEKDEISDVTVEMVIWNEKVWMEEGNPLTGQSHLVQASAASSRRRHCRRITRIIQRYANAISKLYFTFKNESWVILLTEYINCFDSNLLSIVAGYLLVGINI